MQREMEEAIAVLNSAGYRDVRTVWLFANARHERTILCKRG